MLDKLTSPLVCIDTETTGTSVKIDRIVQIGVVKIYPNGERTEFETLINPEISIPPETTKIHGIGDAHVKDAKTFKQLAPGLLKGLHMCDFLGHNVKFDLDILKSEFERAGLKFEPNGRIIDSCKIYRKFYPHTLSYAVKQYLNRPHEGAHTALADARAALEVAVAQLKAHPELPQTVEELHVLFFETPKEDCVDPEGNIRWRNGEMTMNFGKHDGTPLKHVDHGYLRWMLTQDFNQHTRRAIKDALEGVYRRRDE